MPPDPDVSGLGSNHVPGLNRRIGLLMTPALLGGDCRIDGPVPDNPEQPGAGLIRRPALCDQLHERFLEDIFGRIAPFAHTLQLREQRRTDRPIHRATRNPYFNVRKTAPSQAFLLL